MRDNETSLWVRESVVDSSGTILVGMKVGNKDISADLNFSFDGEMYKIADRREAIGSIQLAMVFSEYHGLQYEIPNRKIDVKECLLTSDPHLRKIYENKVSVVFEKKLQDMMPDEFLVYSHDAWFGLLQKRKKLFMVNYWHLVAYAAMDNFNQIPSGKIYAMVGTTLRSIGILTPAAW